MSDDEGDVTYTGPTDAENRMHGHGTLLYPNGEKYEGDFFEDMMHGKGRYTWTDGSFYEGEYRDDLYHGKGKLVLAGEETYEGDFENDERHGFGTSTTPNIKYVGQWQHGKRWGKGSVSTTGINASGEHFTSTYEGDYSNDVRCGNGKEVFEDPQHTHTYEGQWQADRFHGEGYYVYKSKVTNDEGSYSGTFANGVFHGNGTYKWHLTDVTYIGEFKDGVRHGKGCERGPDGTRTGTWINGEASNDVVMHSTVELLTKQVQQLVAEEAPQRQMPKAAPQAAPAPNIPHPVTSAPAGVSSSMLSESDFEGWHAVKLLGRGSFGAAYEAVLHNGRTVCVKIIELGAVQDAEGIAKLHNEIDLMKRLDHPNIVRYYGSLEDKEKKTLNIFMEYVDGGSLTSYANKIKQCGALSEATIQDWSYQLVRGVKYLHDSNVVHRDIKGDNILVSLNTGQLKLADFGCSKSIDDVCSRTHGCKTMVGTPYWMAPEVITCAGDTGGYGPKSDIWSVGCTIVEMITGKPAWPECNSMWAAIYKIANSTGLPPFFQETHNNTSPQFLKFLERMFERSPPKRASAADLLADPFLQGMKKA